MSRRKRQHKPYAIDPAMGRSGPVEAMTREEYMRRQEEKDQKTQVSYHQQPSAQIRGARRVGG